jgi:hypothetical protein
MDAGKTNGLAGQQIDGIGETRYKFRETTRHSPHLESSKLLQLGDEAIDILDLATTRTRWGF